jgi:hypothetical protein
MKTFLYLYNGFWMRIFATSKKDCKLMLRGIGFGNAVVLEVQSENS